MHTLPVGRVLSIILATCLVAGCATTPPAANPIKASWLPPDSWWTNASASGGTLKSKDGALIRLDADRARTLFDAKERLVKASGVQAGLGLAQTDSPNAFATHIQGRPYVIVSLATLDRIGLDSDALATTIGHELAHLHLGHSGDARKEREKQAKGACFPPNTAFTAAENEPKAPAA